MSYVVIRASHAHQMPHSTRAQIPSGREVDHGKHRADLPTAGNSHGIPGEIRRHEESDAGEHRDAVKAERSDRRGDVDEDDPEDGSLQRVNRDHKEDGVEIPNQQQRAEDTKSVDRFSITHQSTSFLSFNRAQRTRTACALYITRINSIR